MTDTDYNSILKDAANNGDLQTVKHCIAQGVDVNANGGFALGVAAFNGHLDIVKYLVEHGADVHADDNYALIRAASNGHLNVVKYLIEHEADIHTQDDAPLCLAIQNHDMNMIRYLVEQGADVRSEESFPLSITTRIGNLDIVKYLVKKGADIHARQGGALYGAASFGHLDIAKYLIEQGADIHLEEKRLLEIQDKNDNQDTIKYLMDVLHLNDNLQSYKNIHTPDVTDIDTLYQFNTNYHTSTLGMFALSSQFNKAMALFAQHKDKHLSAQDLQSTYKNDITLEYILQKTEQLSLIFKEAYWLNKPGKTERQLTDLYNSLTPRNRQKVSYTYQTTRTLMQLQDRPLTPSNQSDPQKKSPFLRRRRQ